MRDLFTPKTNGHAFLKPLEDPFRWVVSVFQQDGATQAIMRANKCRLLTYYPIRFNVRGEAAPLFRNYLFVEFQEYITLDLCRNTIHFVKILSARDDDGLVRPIMVRRTAVDENRAMVLASKFNERMINRRFYGKGSIVRVLEGNFIDKKVRLEMDVWPEMPGRTRVKVDIDGLKGTIELCRLAL